MATPEQRERYVTANGLKLRVLEWGPEDARYTLMCLHGTSMHAQGWRMLAEALEPDVHVFALDQRAHGESEVAPLGQYSVMDFYSDLAQVVDGLGLRRFALIGSSVGSQVALAYAARHPDRATHLILSDVSFECPMTIIEGYIHRHRTRPRIFDRFEDAMAYSRQLEQRSRFTEDMHREVLDGDLRKRPDGRHEWRYALEPIVETLLKVPCDQWDDVRNCTVPTIALRGDDSNVLLPETAARLDREFPNGKVVLIENSGHMIWTDRPDLIADYTRKFITTGRV